MKFSWRSLFGVIFILAIIVIQIVYWYNPLVLKDLLAIRDTIIRLINDYPVAMAVTFILTYTLSIIFGIPISITILGGYFFDVFLGTLYSMIAIFLGSLTLCLLVRFLLKKWVKEKYKDQIKPINKQFEKHGGLYIFLIQVIPFAPSFIPYIAMALSDMSIFRVMAINLMASFPLTLTYTIAGSYVKNIHSIESFIFYISIFGVVFLVLFASAFALK